MKRLYIFVFLLAFSILHASETCLKRTEHTYACGELSLSYTAVTGTLPVHNSERRQLAELFFVAYFADEESNRPITFVFPGGPGGACYIEVLCTFGPRRLLTPNEGKPLLPPYTLIDNPESLLPWTDLVFVDPVTTGYSRFVEDVEEEAEEFFTVDGDIASLGSFIHHFLGYFQKWNAPKYLAGISYGTLRCSGLSEYLRDRDISLHGLILLGSSLDYSTLVGQRNLPLPDGLLIPTFAATAWVHGRLWPDRSLEEVVDYARRFLYEEYIPFTLEPNRLNGCEQKAFFAKLAKLIGLKEATVCRYLGRFDESLYTKEFMGDERKMIGGLDTRYVGDLSGIEGCLFDDPSYRDMQGISCAFHEYLQRELETGNPLDSPYIHFSRQSSWNFTTYDSVAWPDVLQRLRRTLIYNPQMKIFVGSGYFDCRTPFAATEYSFNHLELPPSYKKNLCFKTYQAGHGFVFDHSSLQKLKEDLIIFFNENNLDRSLSHRPK